MLKVQKPLKNSSNKNLKEENLKQQAPICKLAIKLQNQKHEVQIQKSSTIEELAAKMILILSQSLQFKGLDSQNKQSQQIHWDICEILYKNLKAQLKKNKQNGEIKSHKIIRSIILAFQNKQNSKKKDEIQSQPSYFKRNRNQKTEYTPRRQIVQNPNGQFSLYAKAEQLLKKRRIKIEARQKQRDLSEVLQCSFCPDISKSRDKYKINKIQNDTKNKSSVFKRLYQNAKELQLKKEFKKQVYQYEKDKLVKMQTTLRPKINKCSQKIIELKNMSLEWGLSQLDFEDYKRQKKELSNRSFVNVFDKLCDNEFYDRRKNSTIKKLKLFEKSDCSFHPQLSLGTKRLTSDYPSLEERMKIYESKRSQRNIKGCTSPITTVKKGSKERVTQEGNPFKSSINSKGKKSKGIRKMLQRIRTQNSLESKLFDQQVKYKKTLEFDFQSEQDDYSWKIQQLGLGQIDQLMIQKLQRGFNLYEMSQLQQVKEGNNLIQDDKQQPFCAYYGYLFDLLGSNKSELDSEDLTNNSVMPANIFEIISPFAEELAKMNLTLDREQFVWSVENLLQKIDDEKRRIFQQWIRSLFQHSKQQTQQELRHVKTEDSIFELVQ